VVRRFAKTARVLRIAAMAATFFSSPRSFAVAVMFMPAVRRGDALVLCGGASENVIPTFVLVVAPPCSRF